MPADNENWPIRNALWAVFACTAALGVTEIYQRIAGIPMDRVHCLGLLRCLLAILLVLLYSAYVLGPRRAVMLSLIAASVGFVVEVICMHTGIMGQYVYASGWPTLAGVPVDILCFWVVFIHAGYGFSNAVAFWLGRRKPHRRQGRMIELPLMVALDATAVVCIDLLLDPLVIRLGWWRWVHGGGFFGVPLTNFVGWFLIVAVSTGAFRIFEYLRPDRRVNADESIHVMPLVGYAMVGIMLVSWASRSGMADLAWQGGTPMGVMTLAGLGAFARWALTRAGLVRAVSEA